MRKTDPGSRQTHAGVTGGDQGSPGGSRSKNFRAQMMKQASGIHGNIKAAGKAAAVSAGNAPKRMQATMAAARRAEHSQRTDEMLSEIISMGYHQV